MKEYRVVYLQSFQDELDERILYIAEKERDVDRALEVMAAVEEAIEKRSFCAEAFEPIISRQDRIHPYYRIYVKGYIVYYVLYEQDGKNIMEIRNFRHERESRDTV